MHHCPDPNPLFARLCAEAAQKHPAAAASVRRCLACTVDPSVVGQFVVGWKAHGLISGGLTYPAIKADCNAA